VSFFRNALSTLLASVISVPIQLATSILLARWLSVADRGNYSVAIAFATALGMLVELGWGPAVIYRLRRAKAPSASVSAAAITAALGMGAVAAALCLPFQDWIRARLLDGAPLELLLFALAIVPAHLTWVFFGSIARGLSRFQLENASHLLLFAGRLVGVIVALVIAGGGLREALIVYLVVEATVAFGIFAVIARQTGLRALPEAVEVRETLRFGVKAYVSRLAIKLQDRFDVFMLAYFLGDPQQVAFYAVAVTLTAQMKLLPEAVGRAIYPQVAGVPEDEAAALTARALRHSLALSLASLLALAAVMPFAIPWIYGAPYAASIAPFLVLLPGMALYSLFRLTSNYFGGVGRQRANMQTQILASVVNVVLNLVLIPRIGVLGAALANVLSNATGAVLITVAFCEDSGVTLGQILRPRRDDLDPYLRRLDGLRRRLRAPRSSTSSR
jgi:O-antigen/teichoic acid export membrane protein